jgi:hypothetical protein
VLSRVVRDARVVHGICLRAATPCFVQLQDRVAERRTRAAARSMCDCA